MNESIVEQLQELVDSADFVPFKIVLASGDKYVIKNHHLLAFGKTNLIYCFPKSDRFAIIRSSQITNIETLGA